MKMKIETMKRDNEGVERSQRKRKKAIHRHLLIVSLPPFAYQQS